MPLIAGAGHASATARFDDEQLFYLQARGISEKEAQRLVVHGLFNDLIRQVGVPSIEERLLGTVEAELGAALAGHLTDLEIEGIARRCDRLLAKGSMPAPRGHWPAVPWPPF